MNKQTERTYMLDDHPQITWMEVRILEYLKEHKNPVSLLFLRDHIAPDMQTTLVAMVLRLAEHGHVELFMHTDGFTKLVVITPLGGATYIEVIGRRGCG